MTWATKSMYTCVSIIINRKILISLPTWVTTLHILPFYIFIYEGPHWMKGWKWLYWILMSFATLSLDTVNDHELYCIILINMIEIARNQESFKSSLQFKSKPIYNFPNDWKIPKIFQLRNWRAPPTISFVLVLVILNYNWYLNRTTRNIRMWHLVFTHYYIWFKEWV